MFTSGPCQRRTSTANAAVSPASTLAITARSSSLPTLTIRFLPRRTWNDDARVHFFCRADSERRIFISGRAFKPHDFAGSSTPSWASVYSSGSLSRACNLRVIYSREISLPTQTFPCTVSVITQLPTLRNGWSHYAREISLSHCRSVFLHHLPRATGPALLARLGAQRREQQL